MTSEVSNSTEHAANANTASEKQKNESVRILSTLTRLVARNTALANYVKNGGDTARYANAAPDATAANAVDDAAAADASEQASLPKLGKNFVGFAVLDTKSNESDKILSKQDVIMGYAAIAINALPAQYRASIYNQNPIEIQGQRIEALPGCLLIPIKLNKDNYESLLASKTVTKYSKGLAMHTFIFSIADSTLNTVISNSLSIESTSKQAAGTSRDDGENGCDRAESMQERSFKDLEVRKMEELNTANQDHLLAMLSQTLLVKDLGMTLRKIKVTDRAHQEDNIRKLYIMPKSLMPKMLFTPLKYFTLINSFLQSIPRRQRINAALSILNSGFAPYEVINHAATHMDEHCTDAFNDTAVFYRSAIAEQTEAQRMCNFFQRANPEIANQFSPMVHSAAIKLERILQLLHETNYISLQNNDLNVTADEIVSYAEIQTKTAQVMLQAYIKKLARNLRSSSQSEAEYQAYNPHISPLYDEQVAPLETTEAGDTDSFAAAQGAIATQNNNEEAIDANAALSDNDADHDANATLSDKDAAVALREELVLNSAYGAVLPNDLQCTHILGDSTVVALELIQQKYVLEYVRLTLGDESDDGDDSYESDKNILSHLIYAGYSCGHLLRLLTSIEIDQVCCNKNHQANWYVLGYNSPSLCLLQVLLQSGCNLMMTAESLSSFLLTYQTYHEAPKLIPYNTETKYAYLARKLLRTSYGKQQYAGLESGELSIDELIDIAKNLSDAERTVLCNDLEKDDLYAQTQGLIDLCIGNKSTASANDGPKQSAVTELAAIGLSSIAVRDTLKGIIKHHMQQAFARDNNLVQLVHLGYKGLKYKDNYSHISSYAPQDIHKVLNHILRVSDTLRARLFHFTADLRFLAAVDSSNASEFFKSYQKTINQGAHRNESLSLSSFLYNFFNDYTQGLNYLKLSLAISTCKRSDASDNPASDSAFGSGASFGSDTAFGSGDSFGSDTASTHGSAIHDTANAEPSVNASKAQNATTNEAAIQPLFAHKASTNEAAIHPAFAHDDAATAVGAHVSESAETHDDIGADGADIDVHAADSFSSMITEIESYLSAMLSENIDLSEIDLADLIRLVDNVSRFDSPSNEVLYKFIARSIDANPAQMSKLILEHGTSALLLPHSFSNLKDMLSYRSISNKAHTRDKSYGRLGDRAYLASIADNDSQNTPRLDRQSLGMLCRISQDLIYRRGIFAKHRAQTADALSAALLLAEPSVAKLACEYQLDFDGQLTALALHPYREDISGENAFKLMQSLNSSAIVSSLRLETIDSFINSMSILSDAELEASFDKLYTIDDADSYVSAVRELDDVICTATRLLYLTFSGLHRFIKLSSNHELTQQAIDDYLARSKADKNKANRRDKAKISIQDLTIPACLSYEYNNSELLAIAKNICDKVFDEHSALLVYLFRAYEQHDDLITHAYESKALNLRLKDSDESEAESLLLTQRIQHRSELIEQFCTAFAATVEHNLETFDSPKQMFYLSLKNDASELSNFINQTDDLSALFSQLSPDSISSVIHTMAYAAATTY